MLDQGNPTIIRPGLVIRPSLVYVGKRDLLKFALIGKNSWPRKGTDETWITRRCRAVAQKLEIRLPLQRCTGPIYDHIANIYHVAAAMKGIDLRHFDPGSATG